MTKSQFESDKEHNRKLFWRDVSVFIAVVTTTIAVIIFYLYLTITTCE